ncbi:hypothetical protein FSP39_014651 [Pinctada imbricata]|uniref:Uncharacterized protein n=1 Tax=Pinctada imbricata TaxID=66713 RepID=A0AA89C112_PINIB|nr:hypothetical protein FSP39_014651 [Pinctada imbricata]
MADKTGSETSGGLKLPVEVRAAGDYSETIEDNMMEPSIKKSSSSSRFKVAKVDDKNQTTVADAETDNDKRGKHNHADHVGFDLPSENDKTYEPPDSPTGIPVFYAETTSPNDTYGYTNHTNSKTFGKNFTEAFPHVDHYRNLLSATAALKSRPTLAELHEEKEEEEKAKLREPLLNSQENVLEEGVKVKSSEKALKFGWVKGVLIRCLLNIWGVMLFLRLSWVVGQAGVGFTTLIILLSAVVTTITSISMSAICTNGEVKGGGAYYMISRSLGPEFGGAIGLIFSVANAVAIAMYVVGFAETVKDLLKKYDALMVDEMNDIRIIGLITVTLLLIIAIVGMEWEARAQLILLGALLISIANFVIGSFIPPSQEDKADGIVGYRGTTFTENLGPQYTEGENFFSVFAIFFPAATGILAGANISGDLKNAQHDIPKGTFLAILISSIVYIVIAWMLGACVFREASGVLTVSAVNMISESSNVTVTNLSSTVGYAMINSSVTTTVPSAHVLASLANVKNCSLGVGGVCTKGLLFDFQVMEKVSGWWPLITVGIFSATLSSALASLVSAPKVFQAVCKDRIFPKIHFFAKGYGPSENPRRAYVLAYCIGVGFIAIGWRPAFKYYSKWCSLIGALLCVAVMFIINWWTALITFAVVSGLFTYVHYTKPDVNWGSSTQAHVYRSALQASLKLVSVEDHIKNYRPQVLVLTGFPKSRPALVDFVHTLTKKIGLMICGHILEGTQADNLRQYKKLTDDVYIWMKQRKVKAFYNVTTAPNFRLGAQAIMQNVGVGKMKPNILVMGFMCQWNTSDADVVEDYVNTIHDAFDLEYGVGIMRLEDGFLMDTDFNESGTGDFLQKTETENGDRVDTDEDSDGEEMGQMNNISQAEPGSPTMMRRDSGSTVESENNQTGGSTPEPRMVRQMSEQDRLLERLRNRFSRKQGKGTIDVWWLFDDGGLTLLLPYILTTKQQWKNNKLRVFAAGTKQNKIDREQRQMATLLSRFRIECEKMTILTDIGKSPKPDSVSQFDQLISKWILDEDKGETKEQYPWKLAEEDLLLLKDKTKRNLRLKELLLEHSKDASLIVMTLPMPRKGTCPPALYMAWIDTLTSDLPPILLLRGNQSSVLTFYS